MMRSAGERERVRGTKKAELVWQFVLQLSDLCKRCLFVSSFYGTLLSTRPLLSSQSPNIDPAQLAQEEIFKEHKDFPPAAEVRCGLSSCGRGRADEERRKSLS